MEEKGLYKKIAQVMEKVQHLEKDGNIEYGKTKYKYVTEEKVTTAVRQAMIDVGLVILPVSVDTAKVNGLTTVECQYKVVDIDTGQSELLASVGQGSDMQDKGSNKALTGAYKYLLLRTFAIPTGEDPDKTSSAQLDDEGKERKIKAIMEYLDHPAFTGEIEWKKGTRNLDEYKDTVMKEIESLSLQRLTTLHKHVTEMFEIAYQSAVDKELGD